MANVIHFLESCCFIAGKMNVAVHRLGKIKFCFCESMNNKLKSTDEYYDEI
jgi:hypothetical protein